VTSDNLKVARTCIGLAGRDHLEVAAHRLPRPLGRFLLRWLVAERFLLSPALPPAAVGVGVGIPRLC